MKPGYLILIIEDENSISKRTYRILREEGFDIRTVKSGKEALSAIHLARPDLVLMGIMLSDMEGIRCIKAIRDFSKIPIVVVSAVANEELKIRMLDEGADDYLTKPFGVGELLARIRTAIRHCCPIREQPKYMARGLTIDFEKRRIQLNGSDIHFTQNEYKIISTLAKSSGKVMPYDRVMKEVWGPYAENDNKILRVNMVNIRKKILEDPDSPRYIFTETGVGYRMTENEANRCF